MAIVEDFHDILQQIHNKDCLHAGSKKTYARVMNKIVCHIVQVIIDCNFCRYSNCIPTFPEV